VAPEFKIFTDVDNAIVDPKEFNEKSFVERTVDVFCMVPPNSFALARPSSTSGSRATSW
jgi:dCTP deaminase